MLAELFEFQQSIHAALTAALSAYATSGDLLALLAVLPFGIVFGAVHALTPGHSKSVLAAYVVGSDTTMPKALATSLILSVTHIGSAVLLSLAASSLINHSIVGAGRAPLVDWTSRLLLIAIGLWLMFRAFHAKPHVSTEGLAAGFFAGLIPCPLTLFVMTLARARSVPEAGLAFSLTMLLGVAIILASVAIVAVFARRSVLRVVQQHGSALFHFSSVMNAMAGAMLVLTAIVELSR